MKKIIVLIVFSLCLSCQNQINEDKKVVNAFTQKILLQSKFDISIFNDFQDKIVESYNDNNQVNKKRQHLDSIIKSLMQNSENKEVIENYIKEYKEIKISQKTELLQDSIDAYLNNVFSKAIINKYVKLNSSNESTSKKILKEIQTNLIALKLNIDIMNDYKIIHYPEVKNYSEITNSEVYQKLKYDKLENVYFVVFDRSEPLVIFFIVENNKIISFFGNSLRTSKKDPLIPYLLNEE